MAAADEASTDDYRIEVTTGRRSVIEALALILLVGLVVLLSDGPRWLWTVPAGLLLLAPAVASRLFPREVWWLESNTLVTQVGHRASCVDLTRLRSVRRDWVPYRGTELHLTDVAGSTVRLWLINESTVPLRRAVGQRARMATNTRELHDPKTRSLLLLDSA